MKYIVRMTLIMIIMLLVAACRQDSTISAENITITVGVSKSLVGETTLLITVLDDEGKVIEKPGKLSVRGDMNHAGMAPVIRESNQSSKGVFIVPFEWTMGGDWSLEVTLTLANGDIVTETFHYEILAEATDDRSSMTMDHGNMDMGGETSALYLRFTNNSDIPITIVGAETEVSALVEIHETVIENDVASMKPVEWVTVNAGETVDFAPAGKHFMLMQLTQDIVADSQIPVSLLLESGETIAFDATVAEIGDSNLDTTTESGDLVISNAWVRPATAGMTEEGASE